MKTIVLILLAMAVAIPGTCAEKLTLDAAIARATTQHPELAAARSQVEGAQARADQAGAWDNPGLFFRLEAAPRDGDAWNGAEKIVGFSQELSLWGPRGARGKLGQARAGLASADLQVTLAEFEARVRLSFALAWESQQELQLRQEAARIAEQLADLVTQRTENGDAAPAQMKRARAAQGVARAQLEAARARAEAAAADLAFLLGSSPEGLGELGTPLMSPDSAPSDPEASPREEQFSAWTNIAAAEVQLASRQRLPALEIEAGLRTSPEGDAFDVGVRMGLPLWDRGSAGVKAARADEAAQVYRLEAARRDLESRRLAARSRREAAAEALAVYDDQVVPDAEASLRAVEEVFRAGDVGLTEVLQVTREWIESRQGLLDWTVALAEAEAELVRLR